MIFNLFSLEMPAMLTDMLSNFMAAIPGIIGAIFVIIIGLIVSKIIRKVVEKLLIKIQIDKIGDKLNEIDIIDKSNIKIKISSLLSSIIYYFCILIFLVGATDVLGMESISALVSKAVALIPNIVTALIILVIGILVSDGIKGIVTTTCESLGIPSAKLIGNLLFYFLFITVVILALSQAGIQTNFLEQNLSILIGGVAFAFAIGYGFASKDVVSNFLASYYSSDIVKVGDTISLDGVTGRVIDVSKSSIVVETDKSRVIFPLNKVTTEKIEIYK